MKTLYAVGTGPGDPELLTLKTVRLIREADVIFAPSNRGKNMALDIVKELVTDKKTILLDFPMGEITSEDYMRNLKIMKDNIPDGGMGVYVTIGDSTVYSTFANAATYNEDDDLVLKYAPGIPSFIAATNEMCMPLVMKGESFSLIDEPDEESFKYADRIALLKTFRDKEHTLNMLERYGFRYKYISNISGTDEKILDRREDILAEENYISLIIAWRE